MVHLLLDMGQNSSLPKGRRKSLRSFSKYSSKKNSLSHTFTIHEYGDRTVQLNINIASEEELMTLDGVNREIAKSIVEHRKAIGRFRKVEDLALVRGIGADKFQQIRPEICVSSIKNLSCDSSRAQSFDSLRSTESRSTIKSNKLINVNKASIFELQAVNGITQEIAAAIIHHRSKKGNFYQIEDLLKVKGIDRMIFYNISRHLNCDSNDDISESDEPQRSILTNGYTMPNQNGRVGVPLKWPVINGLSISSATDIFELLSAYSPRPVMQEDFKFKRNGEPAIRIASWNLNEFSFDKANNLGVKEVICRTILENGLSIIAVQDVVDVTALRSICDELNKPQLRRIKEWKDSNHNWNFCMLDVQGSKLGFIYDSDGAINIELMSLHQGPLETRNECEALVATFMVGDMILRLVNLMLNRNANIDILNANFQALANEDYMLMVLFDISNAKGSSDEYLSVGNLNAVFTPNTSTTFVYSTAERIILHTSNILHNLKVHQLTGVNGVIRQGLVHLAIPNGWSWGGPVSPYIPVWTELFVTSTLVTAL